MKLKLIESFQTHEELNQKLFDNDVLKEEVRQALLDIVNDFIEEAQQWEIPLKETDIWMVGSNASYNYGDFSDIDIHIIVNMETLTDSPELLNITYNLLKTNYNKAHDITVKGYPVEIYVEDVESSSISNGIYSIKNNEWVVYPQHLEIIDIDVTGTDLYNNLIGQVQELETIDDINNFIDNLYLIRKTSLLQDGEFGEGNLIFKQLRNDGILDMLKDKRSKLNDKRLTLEGKQ